MRPVWWRISIMVGRSLVEAYLAELGQVGTPCDPRQTVHRLCNMSLATTECRVRGTHAILTGESTSDHILRRGTSASLLFTGFNLFLLHRVTWHENNRQMQPQADGQRETYQNCFSLDRRHGVPTIYEQDETFDKVRVPLDASFSELSQHAEQHLRQSESVVEGSWRPR